MESLFGEIEVKNTKPKKQAKKANKKAVLDEEINLANNQMFGSDFAVKISKKAKNPKEAEEVSVERQLKSKKLSLEERLAIINTNVLKVLGKQKNNILVIRDKETFSDYITKAIASGRIAVDTETNNSLDPVTCKLMGLCLYFPGGKQAYIPVNHRDFKSKVLLENQLTEKDCQEQLKRVVDSKIDVIMHNGKFDYEVLKCTCGLEVVPTWDTMICARLLNENEPAGLKEQYVSKIDKSQEKYSIDKLFENVAYADVDPNIFALYAATDSLMTDRLYEVQAKELEKDEYGPHLDLTGKHELKGLRWLFHEVEMPIVQVTAEMELEGVAVDEEYGQRLKEKYNKQLEDADSKVNDILKDLDDIITAWKITPEANEKTKTYVAKKTKMSEEKIEQQFPNIDEIGRFKYGKPKVELLENPINLASPSQLAILFYDILGVPNDSKDGSRKTGKDELKSIKEKLASYLPRLEEIESELDDDSEDVEEAIELSSDKVVAFKLGSAAKLADLILKRRGIAKLVTTYIDVIPELVKHWPDHRIRFHLNSLGTDTGRYSSGGKLKFMENDEAITVSGINIQNIPSHNPEIRMLFTARTDGHSVELNDNYYEVPETDEVETVNGWKKVKDLVVGDTIVGEDNKDIIRNIVKQDKLYLLYI